MKKPTPKKTQDTWDFNEVTKYIDKKYGLNHRDLENRHTQLPYDPDVPYHNFWHWVTDQTEIHNGCFFTLELAYNLESAIVEDWVKTYLRLLQAEFGEGQAELEMWVSW